MDKFHLKLIPTGSCEKAKEVRRKHYKIITSYLDEDFLDIICYHKLHTLTVFSNSVKFKLSDLVKALNNVPQLKILRTYANFIDDIQNVKDVPKVRLNLKELYCKLGIFHIFDCDTLKCFTIQWSETLDSNRKLIYDFMNRQKNLYSLNVTCFDLFTESDNFTCQYELKSFTMTYCNLEQHESFIRFLDMHKKTLEVLRLYSDYTTMEAMEQVQKYVLTNLQNLKDLELDLQMQLYEDVPIIEMSINEPHHATYVTKNIERLEFNRRHRSMEENKRFIDMFPNIKHLSVDSDLGDELHRLMHYISTTKTGLESIDIDLAFDDGQPILYFPNLKVLKVKQYWKEELDSFINLHSSTLEEIDVDCSFGIKESTIREINNCENLKRIKFHPFNQEYRVQIINQLSKFLTISKPLEVTFHYYPLSWIFFKLPEDTMFLDGSLFNGEK